MTAGWRINEDQWQEVHIILKFWSFSFKVITWENAEERNTESGEEFNWGLTKLMLLRFDNSILISQ